MVFINGKKFACESCIKGHRSSSCKHADRPLFEIKKKGRPVSQCDTCRTLRQSRKMHSKCLCNLAEGPDAGTSFSESSVPRKKTSRFVPTTPALPNGISDALLSCVNGPVSVNSKQRIDSLLNPCTCKSVRKCRCRPEHSREGTLPSGSSVVASRNGLSTLADAAALCRGGKFCSNHPSCDTNGSMAALTPLNASTSRLKRQPSRLSIPPNSVHKPKQTVPGPALPPILYSSLVSSHQVPDFPTIPPISIITSLAGTGCTCGLYCACLGCVEHRGEEYASKNVSDCADGCGTCVDWRDGIGLPKRNDLTGGRSKNIVNQFIARAAALPLPPQNRNRHPCTKIDLVNVQVYPPDLFSAPRPAGTVNNRTTNTEVREAAFGIVKVPKLECCGGRCGCPEDGCSCGKSCDGRCEENSHSSSNRPMLLTELAGYDAPVSAASSATNPMTSSALFVPSCCAKRQALVS